MFEHSRVCSCVCSCVGKETKQEREEYLAYNTISIFSSVQSEVVRQADKTEERGCSDEEEQEPGGIFPWNRKERPHHYRRLAGKRKRNLIQHVTASFSFGR